MRLIRPSRRPVTLAQVMRLGLDTPQTLAVLAVLGLFACGALMTMQDDSWRQLRAGEWIWRGGGAPDRDSPGTSLRADVHRSDQEWLAQLAFFSAYSLGGLPLLNLLGGGVLGLSGALVLSAMRGPVERRFVLLMLAFPWFIGSLSVHPGIFTMLGLAATLHCLANRRYWPLPLVFLGWANLDSGVLLGGAALVVAGSVQLCVAPHRSPAILIAAVLCAGATLLTPTGFDLLLVPLDAVARLHALGPADWTPPGLGGARDFYFWLLLAGFLGVAAIRGPRVRRTSTAQLISVAGMLAILAAMSARNIPYFLLAAGVVSSRLFPLHADVSSDRPNRRNLAVAGVFAAATAVALTVAFSIPLKRLSWRPLSDRAIAAIRATPGPMFNADNSGGSLLWFVPERRVFYNGRAADYPTDFLFELTASKQTGDPGTLFDRYRVRSALLERRDLLARTLRELGWFTRYADERWILLSADEGGRRIAAAD